MDLMGVVLGVVLVRMGWKASLRSGIDRLVVVER